MRKLSVYLLLFSVFAVNILCGGEKWLPGPDKRWHVKLEPALEQAKKEKKMVYVLQTGSDWCGYCNDLEKEVLSQKLFSNLAKKYLILVYLDFPGQKVPMPAEQRAYNKKIAREYKFGNGYPEAKVLDADGRVLATFNGYRPEKQYIIRLYDFLKLPDPPEFPAKAKISLKASSGKPAGCSVEIVSWGTSADKVNKPFSAARTIEIAPGKKIYFKVRYQLPEKMRAVLTLTGEDDTVLRTQSKEVSKSGTYIFSVVAPDRIDMWTGVKAKIMPQNKKYSAALATIPCSIYMSESMLSDSEKSARKERIRQLKEKFRKSEFTIVSWGYEQDAVNRPFAPDKLIKLKKGQKIFFKIRYRLTPERRSIIWVMCDKAYSFTASGFEPSSGEIIRAVSCNTPGKRDALKVTLIPRNKEKMDNIISIPCKLIWQ